MKEYIISYKEDNEIGGHKKEILVVGEDFQSCYEEHIQKYPTMVVFVRGKHFTSLEELTSELRAYVHW